MKANELRIGNWVMGNAPFQVDGMQISLAEARVRQGFDIGWQPIPLSEEWVKRFGLNQSNLVGGIYTDGDLYITVDMPKYVHQLQNLYFALTGEELTIK